MWHPTCKILSDLGFWKLVKCFVWAPTDTTRHFSSLILELLGFQVSSLSVPVLLAQQIADSEWIMAAFQSGAAANNICYGAESRRYPGTATFMLKEKVHLEELQKTSQQKPPKLSLKTSILGVGVKENKGIVSEFVAHYPLIKSFQNTLTYVLWYDFFFFCQLQFQAKH